MPYNIIQVGDKFSIPNVPIMAVYKDKKVCYDEARLQRIASNVNTRKAQSIENNSTGQGAPLLPKIWKRHNPADPNRPEFGLIDNVRYDNGILYGDYMNMTESTAKEIAENKHPNRSTEIYVTTDGDILAGLALLPPSEQPRIPLPDMLFNAINGTESIIVDDSGKVQDITSDFAFLDNLIQNKVDEKVEIILKSDIMHRQDKKEVTMAEDNKPVDNSTELELNALKTQLEQVLTANKALLEASSKQADEIAAMKKATAKREDEIMLNSLKTEGFVLGEPDDVNMMLNILGSFDAEGKGKYISTLRKTLRNVPMELNSAGPVVSAPAVTNDSEYGVNDKFTVAWAREIGNSNA